jgi:hypothetical protein
MAVADDVRADFARFLLPAFAASERVPGSSLSGTGTIRAGTALARIVTRF